MWRTPASQYCRATSSTSSRVASDAGQVRRRHQAGLPHDARHRGVGALPRAAARPVGDRDEARRAAAPAGGCRSRAAAPAPRSSAERTRMTAAAAAAWHRVPAARRTAGRSASVPASAVRHRQSSPSGRSFMASLPHASRAKARANCSASRSDVARRLARRLVSVTETLNHPLFPVGGQSRHVLPVSGLAARPTCASSEELDARRHPPSPSGDHRRAAWQPGRLRHAAAGQRSRRCRRLQGDQRSARADQPRDLRLQQRARHGDPASGRAGLPLRGAGAGTRLAFTTC